MNLSGLPCQYVEQDGDDEVGGGHEEPDPERERREEGEQVRRLVRRLLEQDRHPWNKIGDPVHAYFGYFEADRKWYFFKVRAKQILQKVSVFSGYRMWASCENC